MKILEEKAKSHNLTYHEDYIYSGVTYPYFIATKLNLGNLLAFDFAGFNEAGQLLALSTLDGSWNKLANYLKVKPLEDTPRTKLTLSMLHQHVLCEFVKSLPYDALKLLKPQ